MRLISISQRSNSSATIAAEVARRARRRASGMLPRTSSSTRQRVAMRSIEFAERIGLIEELDLNVAERSLLHLDNAGPGNTATLAVNVSGRSMQNDAFIAELERLLKRFPIVRPRILFEVPESTSITDL